MNVEYKKEIATKCYELALQLRLQRKYHFHPDDIAEKFRYHYGEDLPFEQSGFEDVATYLESIKYFFRVNPESGWDRRLRIYLVEDYEWKYKLPVDPTITPQIIDLEPPPPPPAVHIQGEGELLEQKLEPPVCRVKLELSDGECVTVTQPSVCSVKPEPVDDDEPQRDGEVPQPTTAVPQPQAASPALAASSALREPAVPVPRPVASATETVSPLAEPIAPVPPSVVPVASEPLPVVSSAQSQEIKSQKSTGPTVTIRSSDTQLSSETLIHRIINSLHFLENRGEPSADGFYTMADVFDTYLAIYKDKFTEVFRCAYPGKELSYLENASNGDILVSQCHVKVWKFARKGFIPARATPKMPVERTPNEADKVTLIDRIVSCLQHLENGERKTPDGVYAFAALKATFRTLFHLHFHHSVNFVFPGKTYSCLQEASAGRLFVRNVNGLYFSLKAFERTTAVKKTIDPIFEFGADDSRNREILVNRALACIDGEQKEVSQAFILAKYHKKFGTNLPSDGQKYLGARRWIPPFQKEAEGKITLVLRETEWFFQLVGEMASHPAFQSPGASLPSTSGQSTAAAIPADSNQPAAPSSSHISAPAIRVSPAASPSNQPPSSTSTQPLITTPTSQLSSAVTNHPLVLVATAVAASHLPSISGQSTAAASPSNSNQPAAFTFTQPRIPASIRQLSSAVNIRPLLSIPIAVAASHLPANSSPNGAVSGLPLTPPSSPDLVAAPLNDRMMSDRLVKCLLKTDSYRCDAEELSRIYSDLFAADLDLDLKNFYPTSSPDSLIHILAEKIDFSHVDGRWTYRLTTGFRPSHRSTYPENSRSPSRDDDRMDRSHKRGASPTLGRTFPKKSRNE